MTDSKRNDVEVVGSYIMDDIIAYVESKHFTSEVRKFQDENWTKFTIISESKTPELMEQSMEHMEAFRVFQRLIDDLFETFAKRHGVNNATIYESCRVALDGDFMPLFQEDPNKEFVKETLMSLLEYDKFVVMMCDDARKRDRASRK